MKVRTMLVIRVEFTQHISRIVFTVTIIKFSPGTVVNVVNSYAATSEYTPARFDNKVDFPTDGKPTNPIRASPV